MKPVWILIAIFTLTSCNEKKNTTMTYDDSWYVSPGWPGEYPNGFTILRQGVVLEGRPEMNKMLERTVACPVPMLANFNPWNHQRIKDDRLEFVSAAKKFTVTINEDLTTMAFNGEKDEELDLKQGETVVYLTYIAEGFALVDYQGIEYQVDIASLEDKVAFGDQQYVADDLWVNIPCADRQRGWILYAEVRGIDGIGETEHIQYGESPDLSG